MAMGWKMTRQIPIFSSSFRFHPTSCHSLGRDVVSRVTGNLSKILVPSEVYVDAALNKDNSLYFHKILQINKLHRCNQNWPVPGCAKLSAAPKDTNFMRDWADCRPELSAGPIFSEYALKHQQKKGADPKEIFWSVSCFIIDKDVHITYCRSRRSRERMVY